MKKENLVRNAYEVGEYLKSSIPSSSRIKDVRGRGLMLGIQFNEPVKEIRSKLLFDKHVFTGVAGTDMVRLRSAGADKTGSRRVYQGVD